MSNVIKIYECLLAHYGDLEWWPATTPYEVMVGAILTQNTSWHNVEKAIRNFTGRLSPEFILETGNEEIAEIIKPAGFFTQKTKYLKNITQWFEKYNFVVTIVQEKTLEVLRPELLNIKGIGRETADSILLYAFGFPSFVVDAYTIRFLERYGIRVGKDYEKVKVYFEKEIPKDTKIYNNYHALIVINGKNHCRKKPVCENCSLYDQCQRYGV